MGKDDWRGRNLGFTKIQLNSRGLCEMHIQKREVSASSEGAVTSYGRSPIGHLWVSQGRVSNFTKKGLRGSEKELGTITTMIQTHPIAVHSKARRQTVDRSGVSPLWSVLVNVDRMQRQLRVCPGSTPNPRFRGSLTLSLSLLPGSPWSLYALHILLSENGLWAF